MAMDKVQFVFLSSEGCKALKIIRIRSGDVTKRYIVTAHKFTPSIGKVIMLKFNSKIVDEVEVRHSRTQYKKTKSSIDSFFGIIENKMIVIQAIHELMSNCILYRQLQYYPCNNFFYYFHLIYLYSIVNLFLLHFLYRPGFNCAYVGENNKLHHPVMIHRAIFGFSGAFYGNFN